MKQVNRKRMPRPAPAQVDDIFDMFDVLFEIVNLFNALLDAILNFGDFLNGNRPGGVEDQPGDLPEGL